MPGFEINIGLDNKGELGLDMSGMKGSGISVMNIDDLMPIIDRVNAGESIEDIENETLAEEVLRKLKAGDFTNGVPIQPTPDTNSEIVLPLDNEDNFDALGNFDPNYKYDKDKKYDEFDFNDYKVKLQRAKDITIRLFPFFLPYILKIKTYIVKTEPPQGGRAYTDGKSIYFVGKYLQGEKAEFENENMFMFVYMHELFHIIYKHCTKDFNKDRDPQLLNCACDYFINYNLIQTIKSIFNAIWEGVFKYPIENKTFNGLYDEKYKDMSSYQIYELLTEEDGDGSGGKNKKPGGKGGKQGTGQGVGIPKHDNDININFDDLFSDIFDENGKYMGQKANFTMTQAEREEMDEMQNNCRITMNNKSMGNVGLGLGREFSIFDKPRIDWRKQLRRYVQNKFTADFTFNQKERRFMASPFFIPDIERNPDRIKVAVAIDTSGSVGDDELRKFLGEIWGMFMNKKHIQILLICCDAQMYNPKLITKKSELFEYKVMGGGGTDFVPVFEYLEKEKGFDKSCLIYFTDGYGRFPENFNYKFDTKFIMTTDVIPPNMNKKVSVIKYETN